MLWDFIYPDRNIMEQSLDPFMSLRLDMRYERNKNALNT
jgi:hypothetical protein